MNPNRLFLAVQAGAFVVAIVTGFVSWFAPPQLRPLAERASAISFFIGFGLALHRLNVAVESMTSAHGQMIEKISSLNDLNRAETVFLNEARLEKSRDQPHIFAYLKTGKTLGLEHTVRMAASFNSMEVRNPIDVHDPRLTEEFLRNLVLAVEELGSGCVWIGTSLVYRPAGWGTREIATFATAIREKSASRMLKVFRIYHFNTELNDIEAIERDLTRSHISVEQKHGIDVKVLRQNHAIEDVSLLCIPPSGPRRGPRKEPPDLSWDTLRREGWRVAFCLVWHIRDGCNIDRITVHAGEDQSAERYYKSFVELWGRAEKVPPTEPPAIRVGAASGGRPAEGDAPPSPPERIPDEL